MNYSRILTIKNAKLLGYYFYMNLNIWRDFPICISVPLIQSNIILTMVAEMLQKSKFLLYVLYWCYMKFYFCYICDVYVICFIIYLLYIFIYIICFSILLYISIFTLFDWYLYDNVFIFMHKIVIIKNSKKTL